MPGDSSSRHEEHYRKQRKNCHQTPKNLQSLPRSPERPDWRRECARHSRRRPSGTAFTAFDEERDRQMSAQPLIRLSLIDPAEWCWAAVCDSGTGCVEGPSRCCDRCILTCARAFYRRSMIVCRAGRPRPGVSASSAIRWAALRRAGGEGPAKPQGGDRSSRCTEAHADPDPGRAGRDARPHAGGVEGVPGR
jgi:hypothetical protein